MAVHTLAGHQIGYVPRAATGAFVSSEETLAYVESIGQAAESGHVGVKARSWTWIGGPQLETRLQFRLSARDTRKVTGFHMDAGLMKCICKVVVVLNKFSFQGSPFVQGGLSNLISCTLNARNPQDTRVLVGSE